jgi:hypothetical protein
MDNLVPNIVGLLLNSIGVFAMAIGVWKLLDPGPFIGSPELTVSQEEVDLRHQIKKHVVLNWILGGCLLQILANLLQLFAIKLN